MLSTYLRQAYIDMPEKAKHTTDLIAVGTPELTFARSPLGQRLVDLQNSGSRSNRVIAEYLLRNPLRIPAIGIEELASRTGVSAATLSRFARAASFEGYAELRAAAADSLQGMLQPVEKLRSSIQSSSGKLGGANVLVGGLEASVGNVRSAAESLDPKALTTIVSLISRANEVYTLGFGLSSHLASILALDLQPFCARLTNVVEFGGTEVAAGRLLNIGKRDVLIVLSFPRYATDAIRLTSYARTRGAKIVAITDSPASPLAQLADYLLFAPANHPVLSSGLSAALVVVEALVSALMISNPDNVKQASKLTDAIAAYLVDGTDAHSRKS
ncbi:MAG: MurR/RpiR family transcriptional regulator [Betaproteobacteria bacterium]|nr:MAG: MurR/RpiR family transcriptional regulator [Betaproteobacteria bacterium]